MNEAISVQGLLAQIDCMVGKEILYPTGKAVLTVIRVIKPEGGIVFKRRPLKSDKPWQEIKEEGISSNMIWRYVNALNTKRPIHVDRVLGASYNTRSALETLVACCPQFFMCRPKRLTSIGSRDVVFEKSHKYLIWEPEKGHPFGQITWDESINGYVTEVPSMDFYFDVQNVEKEGIKNDSAELPEVKRIHSQMQVLLSETANWMSMRCWVAVEDHGIQVDGKMLMSEPYMVSDLNKERCINNYPEAIQVARHIDCIWFNGGMPFVFEVEHTTGVTSGLTRMQRLRHNASHINTDYVVVAPDDDRQMVLEKSSDEQFKRMNLWYLSYSNLMEMYSFTKKHGFRCYDTKTDFTKMFMEPIPRAYPN